MHVVHIVLTREPVHQIWSVLAIQGSEKEGGEFTLVTEWQIGTRGACAKVLLAQLTSEGSKCGGGVGIVVEVALGGNVVTVGVVESSTHPLAIGEGPRGAGFAEGVGVVGA